MVTLCTNEAEYGAATAAARGSGWLRKFMNDFEYECMVLHIDNRSAISLTGNADHHKRTKHIDVGHNYLREKVEHKLL